VSSSSIDQTTKQLSIQTNGTTPTRSTAKLHYSTPDSTGNTIENFPIPQLSPPGRLSGTAVDEDTIRINWFDESDKEYGYAIQYREHTEPPSGNFVALKTNLNEDFYALTSVTVEPLPPGVAYDWKVVTTYRGSDNVYVPGGSPGR